LFELKRNESGVGGNHQFVCCVGTYGKGQRECGQGDFKNRLHERNSCTGCGLPIFYIAVGAMKKSCHVFNYYKNKELVRDVVP
jgi:hypothetical protein